MHDPTTKRALLPLLRRELLVPALVALGTVLILVSLIEGPAIQDFLYAIF